MAKRGRTPKGEFADKLSNFSTRIRPATRKLLENEAKATGQSISQLAERLLVDGLAKRRESGRDKAMRALCFLIAETAHQVVGLHITNEDSTRDEPAFSWRWSPFFYRAFKLTVGQILDALEPKGDIERPQIKMDLTANPEDQKEADSFIARYMRSFESPEERANYATDYILNYSLGTIPQLSEKEREIERQHLSRMQSPSAWRQFYGMPDVAKDLMIKPTKGGADD
jgi:hypothetical protein